MERNKFIGQEIKHLREQSGITQFQLANYLQVDQSLISRVEKNERQPSVEFIEKISALFGCPTDYFDATNKDISPLKFAFRANDINNEDFETVAAIN